VKQRLDLILQPKLIITPELQLSFELLTAPVLEVKRIVEEELMINPFLEELPKTKSDSPVDDNELPWWERLPAPRKSVEEHLIEQVEVLPHVSEKERAVLRSMVGFLDEKGYLEKEAEGRLRDRFNISSDEFERLRRIFMESVDPVGCGSRSFEEFFALQLKFYGIEEDVQHEDVEEKVRALKEKGYIIKPYPLWGWAVDDTYFVEPDAFVVKVGSYYQVYLNEKWLPRLTFNDEYRALVKNPELESSVKEFLTERMKRALSLLKAIEQRNKTLRKTVEAIVEFEYEFLEKGPEYLKPLSLKDVAEKVGVHISTVSRVVNSKYVHTPQGTYSLKYFFADKGFVVKKRIRELIEAEDKRKPLSDRAIADILKEEGFDIARRTVAKYREELGIPPSSKRRVRREKCR